MEVSSAYADWLTNFLLTSLLGYMLYVLFSIVFTFKKQELSLTRAKGQIELEDEKDISEEEESFELEETEPNDEDEERVEGTKLSSNKKDGDKQFVTKKGSSENLGTATIADSSEEFEKIKKVTNDKLQKVDHENVEESLKKEIVKASDTPGSQESSVANVISLPQTTEGNQDTTEFVSQSKSSFPKSNNFPSPSPSSSSSSSLAEDDPGKASLKGKGEMYELEEEWEGVETSEIEDDFDAAATFVGSLAVGQGTKITQEMQLGLYGLYKQATVGQCSIPQPSLLNMSSRAKWNAWKRLGGMKTEDAMEAYIHLVETICPGWSQQEGTDSKQGENRINKMGPVFSTLSDETAGEEGSLQALQASASEGDILQLQKLLKEGCPIDGADEEGRTPLHWAADRGHLEAARLLLAAGASVDKRDTEGQTALHYASICGHKAMAEELLKFGADRQATDMDGTVPDLSAKNWQILGENKKSSLGADLAGGK